MNIRINWRYFDENRSTMEELLEFAYEGKGLNALRKGCWPRKCKREVDKMKKLGARVSRSRARRFLG